MTRCRTVFWTVLREHISPTFLVCSDVFLVVFGVAFKLALDSNFNIVLIDLGRLRLGRYPIVADIMVSLRSDTV